MISFFKKFFGVGVIKNSLLTSSSKHSATKKSSYIETRISGSFSTRYLLELFSNSAYFPIANILFELLIEGPFHYLKAPDLYVILTAILIQAYFLTIWDKMPKRRRFLGNLIGPAIYTVIESLIEGTRFFAAPHHLAYWGFSIVIGALQAVETHLPSFLGSFIVVIENVVRTAILFYMYAMFEMYSNPKRTLSFYIFFSDSSHVFIVLAVLFFGFSIGFATLTSKRYLNLLKETSAQLKIYSEWLLGRNLLEQTFVTPSVLGLKRQERTVLFMDIRGFTHWSEPQSPETVVNLLNEYYSVAEAILVNYGCIKFKLTADEIMAVFPSAASAAYASLELSKRINELLSKNNLGAGIGLHSGLLVEGLLGSAGVKFYDVIGDTVNTAKRIESAALAGEILISESVKNSLSDIFNIETSQKIKAKGKENLLTVYKLKSEKNLSTISDS